MNEMFNQICSQIATCASGSNQTKCRFANHRRCRNGQEMVTDRGRFPLVATIIAGLICLIDCASGQFEERLDLLKQQQHYQPTLPSWHIAALNRHRAVIESMEPHMAHQRLRKYRTY